MTKNISCLILVVVLSFNTAKFQFARQVFSNGKEETTSGEAFFDKNLGTILFISEPIKQEIYIAGDKCNIYYPKENRVISLSASLFSLSFLDYFLGQGTNYLGLTERGFKVDKIEPLSETTANVKLISGNDKNVICNIVKEGSHKIISLEGINNKKNHVKANFKDHLLYQNRYFSQTIEINNKTSSGVETKEIVHLKNVSFDETIPPEKFNFKIPQNAKVENIKMQ